MALDMPLIPQPPAFPAKTPPVRLPAGVLFSELVASAAVRSASLVNEGVLRRRKALEMMRIHTQSVVTAMVNDAAFRNGPKGFLVGQNMNQPALSIDISLAIATRRLCAGPKNAVIVKIRHTASMAKSMPKTQSDLWTGS
jgi:hypothetical protein